MPQIDLMKEYIESQRPHIDEILRYIKVDFEATGDTIHIWKAMQWCERYKSPTPSWIDKYIRKQILSGEGIKFDGRSIRKEKLALRNYFISYLVYDYVHQGKSRDMAISEVQRDLEKKGLQLSVDTIEGIYAERIAMNNKAEKFAEESLRKHKKFMKEFKREHKIE